MLHATREVIPSPAFFSDMATSGMGKWTTLANPDLMTVMEDPFGPARKVVRMAVPNSAGGPSINPRAQASTSDAIRVGTEFWLGFGVYLPAGDYQLDTPYGYLSLMQMYGPPFGGFSPFNIGFTGTSGTMGWRREPDQGDDWACPITPQYDAWMDFACHVKVSADPAVGFGEIWQNFGSGWQPCVTNPVGGTVVTTPAGGKRLYTAMINDATSLGRLHTDAHNYRKVDQIPGTVTVYHTDHRRIVATGNDLADIAAVNPGSYA